MSTNQNLFFYAHIRYNVGMVMQAAKELAERRWKKTTKKQRQEVGQALTEARKEIPPETRKAAASAAAKARWDRVRAEKAALEKGVKKKAAAKKGKAQ